MIMAYPCSRPAMADISLPVPQNLLAQSHSIFISSRLTAAEINYLLKLSEAMIKMLPDQYSRPAMADISLPDIQSPLVREMQMFIS